MKADFEKLERCIVDDVLLENWQEIPMGFGTHCISCMTVYEINDSTGKVYVKKHNTGNFVCKDCGSTIMAVKRAYPIHEFPEHLAGSGRCDYEEIPYCPKCEEKPSEHGAAISFEESSEFEKVKKIKEIGKHR